MKVSVVIPSRTERFLPETVADVLKKAAGDVEVVAVIEDSVIKSPMPAEDSRVKLVLHPGALGMRTAINHGVREASGEFIMKLDAHCMMAEGWDEELKAACEDNDIWIPRRKSLDPETWSIRTHRPIVDYEFISYPYTDEFTTVRQSNKWFERAEERKDILLDETPSFQGSCYFMKKAFFDRLGGLQTEGYESIICESEEIGNKCWTTGGRVMVNKKTWYAHLHKGKQYGRMYFLNRWEMRRGRKFHIDLWMHDKWQHPDKIRPFEWIIDHFWPMPTWPADWKTNPEYENAYLRSIGSEP